MLGPGLRADWNVGQSYGLNEVLMTVVRMSLMAGLTLEEKKICCFLISLIMPIS
jgi:hypothetical protein